MTKANVFSDGKLHVCRTQCSTCIFRPGNLMRLKKGRVEGMVEKAVAEQGVIPCHHTLHQDQQAVCRGFFGRMVTSGRIPTMQIAQRLGAVVNVDPDDTTEVGS